MSGWLGWNLDEKSNYHSSTVRNVDHAMRQYDMSKYNDNVLGFSFLDGWVVFLILLTHIYAFIALSAVDFRL